MKVPRNRVPGPITAALAVGVAALASSCWMSDNDQRPRSTTEAPTNPGAKAPGAEPEAPRQQPWRDLLAETGRAELDVAGPFVDVGTVDQHKYTYGGWLSGWGDTAADEAGVSYGTIAERKARLMVPTQSATAEVVVRARSKARKQQMTVRLDGERIGKAKLGDSWSVLRFEVPAPAAGAGRRDIELAFSSRRTPAADVDWVWLATSKGSEPPAAAARVKPVKVGDKVRRALVADTPRRYSFYLHVPEAGALGFDYGADGEVEFRVAAYTADGEANELFRETATAGQWRGGRVDLSTLAGQAIRLDLITAGPSARAGWGNPTVYAAPAPPKPARPTAKPKNVILVVYDTTRADSFAPFDPDTRVLTPNYDALAKRSTAFTRAYNNEAWTRPSTSTIVTGLYPDTHRAIYARDELTDEIELLSEHLASHGLTTAAVLGNSVLGKRFGFGQGWDYYVNDGRTDDSAENIYGKSIAWLEDNHDKPFFLWIQSHDSHTPYKVDRKYVEPYFPDEYSGYLGPSFTKGEQISLDKGRREPSDTDVAWARALYDGEATYQDEGFGRLIDRLEELGVADDTLIVVTNDHGEEFGDHGGWGHGWTQQEEMLRSPLLFHYPPLFGEGAVVDDIVEHVDVAPTIVDVLGLPPMSQADGVSMVPLLTDRPVSRPRYAVAGLRDRYRTVIVGRWKLVVDTRGGWYQLHDLGADPGETTNRAEDAPIAGRLCEVYLSEALGSPRKSARHANIARRRRFQSRRAKMDAATRRELESLGYLGTGRPDE